MRYFFLFILSLNNIIFSYSPGEIPLEWSDQWGFSQKYGLSFWGMESHQSPLHFDGNFLNWNRRYQFPFPSEIEDFDEENSFLSSFSYRQGDYSLDELSFDLQSRPKVNRNTRFRALKRNFEDYHGSLDLEANPGGTIQQNYRLDSQSIDDKGGNWKISSGVYLTTGGVPVWDQVIWSRGLERNDKIIQLGTNYRGMIGETKYTIEGSTFLQRVLNRKKIEDISTWSANLLSNRFKAIAEFPIQNKISAFISLTGRQKAVSSDTLGNQRQEYFSILGGLRINSSKLENRMGIGVSTLSSGIKATSFRGHFKVDFGKNQIFLNVKHDLLPLPFQFTGKQYMFVPDYFTPSMIPSIRPDSSIEAPKLSLVRLGALTKGKLFSSTLTLFVSQKSPHHYFELIKQFNETSILELTSSSTSLSSGLLYSGKINYIRDWVVSFSGKSFFHDNLGWENFFKHEQELTLFFREKLFNGRMDARLNLTYNHWLGRTYFEWDPVLNMGYNYLDRPEIRNSMGVFSAEFSIVIRSVEFSYVMKNLEYALESTPINTFSPTQFFPPAHRLAYLSVKWKLTN